jgi:pimeloyl-ACP methyl ester carboxylesterase
MTAVSEHQTSGGLSYSRVGKGPAVVLVHGWCCDRTFLAPQQAHLAPTHTVVSLDLRGHGTSRWVDELACEITDFADDVAEVAADAGLSAPVVVGHSMGGLVALECAARGLASAAVLVDPAPMLDESGRAYFARSWPEVADDADGSWRRRFAERTMLATDRVRRVGTLDGMARVPPSVAAASMRGMADYDAGAALEAVTVPLLVVSAAHPEDMRAVRGRCRHLMTGQAVGAGHFLQLEVPEQVNPMIDRFLALSLPPGGAPS